MEGLTWKMLAMPEYVMTFVQGFLVLFIPAVAGGNVLDAGSFADVKSWPSGPTLAVASGAGLFNGIQYLRNLRSPVPQIPGMPGRRATDPPPTPPPGG